MSISYAYRNNELVVTARYDGEEIAAINSKNADPYERRRFGEAIANRLWSDPDPREAVIKFFSWSPNSGFSDPADGQRWANESDGL